MTLLKNAIKKIIFNFNNYSENKGNFHRTIQKSHPKLYKKINSSFGQTFNMKAYCILNDIIETPFCKFCGIKTVSFKNINEGFKSYCSDRCAHKDPDFHKKRKASMFEKYGVEYPLQVKEFANKVSEKNKIIFANGSECRKKCEATLKANHGVNNPMELKEFRAKISKKHALKTKDEIEKSVKKRKQTKFEKYGDENFKNDEKIKTTLFEKYGIFFPNQIKCSIDWVSIKDKKEFLENTLQTTHPLKIAKDFNLAYSTVYKLIERFKLKHLVRKTFNAENEINTFVKSLGFETKTNDRKILNGQEIDILVPEANIGIEHNGLYWHSEKNGKDEHYHLNKTIKCEEKGIKLFHIFEHEWIEKQEIVKSLISNGLKIWKNEIHFSECKIKKINKIEKSSFLKENNLFGDDESNYWYGLTFNGELVELITAVKKEKDVFEIVSHCKKLNFKINNGFEKLISFLKSKHNLKSVLFFVDRRFELDDAPINLKHIDTIKPNILYLEKSTYKIWDCGSLLFEFS